MIKQNKKLFMIGAGVLLLASFIIHYSLQKEAVGAPAVFISTPTTTRVSDFSFTIGTSTPLSHYGSTTLAVYGSTTVQTWLDTLHAFRVINAASTTVFVVDTVNSRASTTNLVISGINGSAQCLQISSTGVVSGSGSGCGGTSAFEWTAQSWGNSTSTTLGFLNGFLSQASSTVQELTITNSTTTQATSTFLRVSTLASVQSLLVTDLTSTRIPFVNSVNTLVDSSGLTFDSIKLELTTTNLVGTNATTTSATTTALAVSGTGTSTRITGSLQVGGYFDVQGASTATSTFAHGIRLTGGCFQTVGGACAGGGGTPGGSTGQIQYNNAGAFGGVNKCFASSFVGLGANQISSLHSGLDYSYTITEVKAKATVKPTTTPDIAYSGYGWNFTITHGANQNTTTTARTYFSTATNTPNSYTTGFNDTSVAADEIWFVHTIAASTSAQLGTTTASMDVQVCGTIGS